MWISSADEHPNTLRQILQVVLPLPMRKFAGEFRAPDAGGRPRRPNPSPLRSWGTALASWAKMLGEGGLFIKENGAPGPSRLKGNGLLPGVRSRGEVPKGIFIGADLGMTSGLSGSSPGGVLERGEEADLWSSSWDLSRLPGLGVRCGGDPSFWLPSSGFLFAVDKS